MERTRRRVDAIVRDTATADALKPYYHYFCKRPCFHDEYLQTFNRPNVALVDTHGKGVERITPTGVVVEGKDYPVDCLIYATGFDFMTEFTKEAGFDIRGRDGIKLSDHWVRGARTLYGMQTAGFPNFFLISLVQAGVAINYVHIAEEQSRHIAYIIAQANARGATVVEARPQAEEDWVEEVLARAGPRRAFLDACTPGYYNFEGRRDRAVELNDLYAAGPEAYIRILEQWRARGDLAGLTISVPAALASHRA
jgi:cyclohexanone monooxygenase